MDRFGTDFDSTTGSVMSRAQLEDQRRKRGECVTCGQKCFQKKLFKSIPLTLHGKVLNGRCLNCHPLSSDAAGGDGAIPVGSQRAICSVDSEQVTTAQVSVARPSGAQQQSSTGSMSVSQRRAKPRGSGRPAPPRTHSGQPYQRNASNRSLPNNHSRHGSGNSVGPSSVRPSDASVGSDYSFEQNRSFQHSNFDGGSEHLHDLNGERARYASREASGHSADDVYYGHSNRGGSHRRLRPGESARSMDADVSDELRYASESSHRILNRGGEFVMQSSSHTPSSHSPQRYSRNMPRGSIKSGSSHTGSGGRFRMDSQRSLGSTSAQSFEQESSSITRLNPLQEHLEHHLELQQRRMEEHWSTLSKGGVQAGSYSNQNQQEDEVDYGYGDEQDLPPGIAQLRDAQTFVDVLNVMRDFSNDIETQSAALHELSELQLSAEDSELLAQMGGLQLIVNAMFESPGDLDLQISGCRAVWNASGTVENQRTFVDAQVLEIITQDMESFLAEDGLQEQALAALANLAALEMNLDLMFEQGVFKNVVNVMNRHSEKVAVLIKGSLVIANLSSHPTDHKTTMMEQGGGGALVVAMVMHPSETELQEKALRGLRNLSANCDENKVELTNIGGIDAVIGAMQVHRDSAGVQEAGAWTLSNLASNADSNAQIGDCGGVDVLVRAMWVHTEAIPVLEWCCRALFTLALDAHNSKMILEVGGIAAVLNAMQVHMDSSAVIQEMGCAVLGNLSSDEPSKLRIVGEGALDAIVLAMVLYTEDESVQLRACHVLLQLTIPQNLKAMRASNVAELVRTASDKFPESCCEPTYQLLEELDNYSSEYS